MTTNGDLILFATGSYSGDDANDRLQLYDLSGGTESGEWITSDSSSLIDAPVAVDQAQGGVIDRTLYVVGGETGLGGSEGAEAATQAYDIDSNEWSLKAPMSAGVAGGADAVFKGKLYVFGGKAGSGGVTHVQIYDPETNEWTEGADFPDTSGQVTSAAAYTAGNSESNAIYVFGGNPNDRATWRYEPEQDEWMTDLADLPTPRSRGGSAVCGNYVYLPAGTRNGNHSNRIVDRYDIAEDTWDQEPQLAPYSMKRSSMVVSDGESLYLLGGGDSFSNKRAAVYRTSDDQWTEIPPLQYGGADSAVAAVVSSAQAGDETATRSASSSVIAWVPGLSENDNQGGNDLYSAFPNNGPINIGGRDVALPPADRGFLGDNVQNVDDDAEGPPTIGTTVADMVSMRKTVQELEGEFRRYRFKNTVEVRFEVQDESKINTESPVTVRVNTVLGDTGRRVETQSGDVEFELLNSEDPEPLSTTILEEESGLLDYPPYDGDRTETAHPRDRYTTAQVGEFTFDGEEYEGVRVASLWGAENPVTRQIGEANPAPWGQNPIIHSWIDMVLLADGTYAVQIQDASQFPMQTLYTGPASAPEEQLRRTDSGLEIIYDTAASTDNEYAAAVNENNHAPRSQFFESFENGTHHVPFTTPHRVYLEHYDDDETDSIRPIGYVNERFVDHPMMMYGEASDGSELSSDEIEELMEGEQIPFPGFFEFEN